MMWMVRGQTGSDDAGGEILGARRLLRRIGVAGRVVTADALHTCPKTARLIADGGGDYVMDGFWDVTGLDLDVTTWLDKLICADPDRLGPNCEIRGTPHPFVPFSWTIEYDNPKKRK